MRPAEAWRPPSGRSSEAGGAAAETGRDAAAGGQVRGPGTGRAGHAGRGSRFRLVGRWERGGGPVRLLVPQRPPLAGGCRSRLSLCVLGAAGKNRAWETTCQDASAGTGPSRERRGEGAGSCGRAKGLELGRCSERGAHGVFWWSRHGLQKQRLEMTLRVSPR